MHHNKLFWVGLTGGIGTGKSTVASVLRTLGEVVVDADAMAREVLSSEDGRAFSEILEVFGPSILTEQKSINRRELGRVVFLDKSKLGQLEAILHPLIRERVERKREEIYQDGIKRAFYDVPLLFEKKMTAQFEKIVVVECSEENQYRRLRERNNWNDGEIESRLRSQLFLEQKVREADFVISNNGTKEDLRKEVERLIHTI